MDKGWHSPFFHYAESITRIEGKIPKSSCSSLMDVLKKDIYVMVKISSVYMNIERF